MKKVFLDAGHGGKDSGATGYGLREKDIVLSVTIKVGNILEKHGVKVVYSRTTDKFIDLKERSDHANREKSDIFVSIHANASNNSKASGVETYSYLNSKNGDKLSKNIYESIINSKYYTQSRGTKTANFAVLRNTKMPSVLVELGFITNERDVEILKSGQDKIAKSIAQGILNHMGVKYVEEVKKDEGKTYRVQLGAFKDRKNAENLVEELKKKGYEAVIV